MRFRRLLSLVLLLSVLSAGSVSAAAVRDADGPSWEGPIKRVVKVLKKLFLPSTNSNVLVGPTP